MGIIAKFFYWIKKLLKKEKLPESIKIQAENSFIIAHNLNLSS